MRAKVVFPFQSTFIDYPDSESMAVLVYFKGCDFQCLNCSNPSVRDYSIANQSAVVMEYKDFIFELYKKADSCRTNRVVLSGGDPLSSYHIDFTRNLVDDLRHTYDFCIYTGNDIQYVKEKLIRGFKFIKCGQYNEKLKQESMKTDFYLQFASKNQQLYNGNFKLLSDGGRFHFREVH